MTRSLFRVLTALAVTTAASVGVQALTTTDAYACGGFFCNVANPVDQAGEEILFAVDGTDVTAHIRIMYQGDAADFSWVLPVPSLPTFGVGSDTVFDALKRQTDPRFEIAWDTSGDCQWSPYCFLEADGATSDPSAPCAESARRRHPRVGLGRTVRVQGGRQ